MPIKFYAEKKKIKLFRTFLIEKRKAKNNVNIKKFKPKLHTRQN